MKDALRLNKSSLREQKDRLGSLLEFLPTLRLRQQQLQAAVAGVRQQRARVERQRAALHEGARSWAGLLRAMAPVARPHAEVEQVVTATTNVAGVAVSRLEHVRFVDRTHDLLATPLSFDDAVGVLRQDARLHAERSVLERSEHRLAQELARTSQRINLYEKVLVPRTQRNIRRLRVYLGDQQTAAVGRAKLAKAKAQARPRVSETGAEHGHR
ncbi:V-type ATP synthase subunit D [Paraliomyxa miuraensis]|uniref:V-type ATP synthase subunit D n=1 Tax=Paraliomyxa miuraensis TaxID=376150 RepID=UPI002250C4EF|nr:V-type ATP synthase subunit D [Paraliomyxa miuraensis]MCX4247727.1 V-type ATP synthase subunit D [Paraliomyxa miuraensis]